MVPPEGCTVDRDCGPETAALPKIIARPWSTPVSGPTRPGCAAPGNLRPGADARAPAVPRRGAPVGTNEDLAQIRDLRRQKRVPRPDRGPGRVHNLGGRPHKLRQPSWSNKSPLDRGPAFPEGRLHSQGGLDCTDTLHKSAAFQGCTKRSHLNNSITLSPLWSPGRQSLQGLDCLPRQPGSTFVCHTPHLRRREAAGA
ncbi:hypothetical protein NDU88_002938 [Pleurodeles waltl]|uniref:Uncharacterized protein n=1 Tax=Pleurodeles waltl TaxID=8319 RepID=A0AAV7W122_PLEWA|nr:hypothetical protein NDU88_002938 [Pleurodeles waltl]